MSKEIYGSRGILLQLKDNLSQTDTTRALKTIGFSKKEIDEMNTTNAQPTILEREIRAMGETLPRKTGAAIAVHEQPLSQDTWKETLKNAVIVARTKKNREVILSIVRKLLHMPEVKR